MALSYWGAVAYLSYVGLACKDEWLLFTESSTLVWKLLRAVFQTACKDPQKLILLCQNFSGQQNDQRMNSFNLIC